MSAKMRNHIVVVRRGWQNTERSIQLVCATGGVCWVDPAREVSQAIGLSVERYSCMVSFCDGLAASGKYLVVSENFFGQKARQYTHLNRLLREELRDCVKPMFFLLGLAWGRKKWLPLKRTLSLIPLPRRRLEIFSQTADQLIQAWPATQQLGKQIRLSWLLSPEEQRLVFGQAGASKAAAMAAKLPADSTVAV